MKGSSYYVHELKLKCAKLVIQTSQAYQPNTREQSSWEANNRLASHEIHDLSHNPKTHYRVHKSRFILFWVTLKKFALSRPIYSRYILISSSSTCLSYPSAFQLDFLRIPSLSHACYMPRPSHTQCNPTECFSRRDKATEGRTVMASQLCFNFYDLKGKKAYYCPFNFAASCGKVHWGIS
jgi:hypothetical protein